MSKINQMDGEIDEGIKPCVEMLRAINITTTESCEGGEGHAYPHPIIRFHGHQAAGWEALAALLNHGVEVVELRRIWQIVDGEPTGPEWEVELREAA